MRSTAVVVAFAFWRLVIADGGAAAQSPDSLPGVSSVGITYAVGADLSFLKAAEDRGVQFKDDGVVRPGLDIFRDHGYDWIRLRLFHPHYGLSYTDGKSAFVASVLAKAGTFVVRTVGSVQNSTSRPTVTYGIGGRIPCQVGIVGLDGQRLGISLDWRGSVNHQRPDGRRWC